MKRFRISQNKEISIGIYREPHVICVLPYVKLRVCIPTVLKHITTAFKVELAVRLFTCEIFVCFSDYEPYKLNGVTKEKVK